MTIKQDVRVEDFLIALIAVEQSRLDLRDAWARALLKSSGQYQDKTMLARDLRVVAPKLQAGDKPGWTGLDKDRG